MLGGLSGVSHTHAHTHTHTYTHSHTHTHTCTHMSTYVQTRTCTHTHTHTHTHLHTHVYTYTHARTLCRPKEARKAEASKDPYKRMLPSPEDIKALLGGGGEGFGSAQVCVYECVCMICVYGCVYMNVRGGQGEGYVRVCEGVCVWGWGGYVCLSLRLLSTLLRLGVFAGIFGNGVCLQCQHIGMHIYVVQSTQTCTQDS